MLLHGSPPPTAVLGSPVSMATASSLPTTQILAPQFKGSNISAPPPTSTAPTLLTRGPGSTPNLLSGSASSSSLPSAPLVLRQTASTLPQPIRSAAGALSTAPLASSRVPSTTGRPAVAGSALPVRQNGVQRCFSTGCLQSPAPQVGAEASPASAVRYYSGVIRGQATPTMPTGGACIRGTDAQASRSEAPCSSQQKVIVVSREDEAAGGSQRRQQQQPSAVQRVPSSSSIRGNQLQLPGHAVDTASTSQASAVARSSSTPTSSRPSTSSAPRQCPVGAGAVGRLHHTLAKPLGEKKPVDLRALPTKEKDSPRKQKQFEDDVESVPSPRASSRRQKSGWSDSGGTGGELEREAEAVWERPYSVRAASPPPRSGTGATPSALPTRRPRSADDREATARRKRAEQRSESQKRRFKALYEDHQNRQQKWLVNYQEKVKQEEEELHYQVSSTISPRPFNSEEFNNWYSDSMSKKREFVAKQTERQRSEARLKAFQELSQCTFAPVPQPTVKVSTSPKSAGGGSVMSEAQPLKGFSPTERDARQAQADEIVAAQVAQIDAMRQLDIKEKDLRVAAFRDSAVTLERSLEEGRRKLKLFEDTPEGHEYLTSRAQSYLDLNPGMSQEAAMAEARNDLSQASETKLQAQAAQMKQQRANADSQQIQLARLKVAWELIQLQRRCTELIEKNLVPKSMLQGFDAGLVDRLTKEPWYAQAKNAAKNLT